MSSPEFPRCLVTCTEDRSVVITPDVEATIPGVASAFEKVDQAFLYDPKEYLTDLKKSVFSFKSGQGAEVTCSLLVGPESKKDEILVVFMPFADRSPKSSAEEIYNYIASDDQPSFIEKEKAAPNSWGPIAKSSTKFELLSALGEGMPVLTIFSPIPPKAYTSNEREQTREGNFSSAGWLAIEAISHAQDSFHGPGTSETRINKAHLQGASLGATNAIAAARSLHNHELEIQSVTAQELILGPKNLADLFKRYTWGQYVGKAAVELASEAYLSIEEPALRSAIDRYGSELIGMNARTIKAMAKRTYMKGLTKPERTAQAIADLSENGVGVLVALAENSGVTELTKSYLPSAGEKVLKLKGKKNKKDKLLGHLVNEHVSATAIVTALGVSKKG